MYKYVIHYSNCVKHFGVMISIFISIIIHHINMTTMKKFIPDTMIACLLLLFFLQNVNANNQRSISIPNPSYAIALVGDEPSVEMSYWPTESIIKDINHERALVLKSRLYDIKAMDISALSSTERRALRKELRSIKNELDAITTTNPSGGIYLSLSAIIIILLLIILI
jgi:hypothetical protein